MSRINGVMDWIDEIDQAQIDNAQPAFGTGPGDFVNKTASVIADIPAKISSSIQNAENTASNVFNEAEFYAGQFVLIGGGLFLLYIGFQKHRE